MDRITGYLALVVALLLAVGAGAVALLPGPLLEEPIGGGLTLGVALSKLLATVAIVAAGFGIYVLTYRLLRRVSTDRRRLHDVRNILRLVFGGAILVAVLGVLTQQWVGVLFSLGIVGFAITFALQQPLFSLIGWLYIVVKRPYHVGDRVAIEGSKGDVVEIDFLVTTLWEVGGELVSSNQPSGRTVTLPNSVVLSSHVANYSLEGFPYVWNELGVQVAFETDLEFAIDLLAEEAEAYLGEEMRDHVEEYRGRLAETPVDLSVADHPTVNVIQRESWVELRLRYLVGHRDAQRVRNELYRRVLARLNDHPDRVAFPVSRNR